MLPRAAADTRGQYSTLRYAGASIVRYAMQGPQRGAQERREGGTRERRNGAKEVAREEERRRDEGTGEGAKEVARTAGGEAAGARVIGGRGGRRHAMEKRM